jgi:hypothetical protein
MEKNMNYPRDAILSIRKLSYKNIHSSNYYIIFDLKTIKFYNMKKGITFLSLLFAVVFVGFGLKAQELEVTPGTMMFSVNAGSSQTQQVFVRNKAKTPQNFVFNLADWLVDEKGETKYLAPGTTGRSCADLITVSAALVSLQPN